MQGHTPALSDDDTVSTNPYGSDVPDYVIKDKKIELLDVCNEVIPGIRKNMDTLNEVLVKELEDIKSLKGHNVMNHGEKGELHSKANGETGNVPPLEPDPFIQYPTLSEVVQDFNQPLGGFGHKDTNSLDDEVNGAVREANTHDTKKQPPPKDRYWIRDYKPPG